MKVLALCQAVLRIRNILVQIQTCLWLFDPDPDPAIFVIDLQDANTQQKTIFSKFFCLLLFEAIFTSFFKDEKSQRSHKTIGIKVFLLFLLYDRRIRIWSRRVPLTNGYRSRRLKTYGFYGSRSATLVPRVKLFSCYCSFLNFYFVHEVMHKYALTLRCSLLSHYCDLHSVQIMFNYFQVNQYGSGIYIYIFSFIARIFRCLHVYRTFF